MLKKKWSLLAAALLIVGKHAIQTSLYVTHVDYIRFFATANGGEAVMSCLVVKCLYVIRSDVGGSRRFFLSVLKT